MEQNKKNKTIVLVGGYGSTNIGNDFYNKGCQYVFEKYFPDFSVKTVSDQAFYYWSGYFQKDTTFFDYISSIESDYLVITGPMLSKEYVQAWEKNFEKMDLNKTKIVLLSAGGIRYDESERRAIEAFLNKYKHYALITRDADTYNFYSDYFEHAYSGICFALFVSDYAPKFEIKTRPYVVFNFEGRREPKFRECEDGDICLGKNKYVIEEERSWNKIKENRRIERIGDYEIVRTYHTTLFDKKRYKTKQSNVYLSDVPEDYLNIYANAEAVFTDRVHAAVVSASYGTPVMLMNDTPRGKILNRIKCDSIYRGLGTASQSLIKEEKEKLVNSLKKIII